MTKFAWWHAPALAVAALSVFACVGPASEAGARPATTDGQVALIGRIRTMPT